MMRGEADREGCVVELDIVGFTKYKNADEQREVLRIFQRLLDKAGKFITPYGSFVNKYLRHGTGDGYYIILDDIPPVVALQFVWLLMEELDLYNEKFGSALPLHLRCVLGYGKIELVGDQLFGSVLSDAERLISDARFKEYQQRSGKNAVLFLTNLFYLKLMEEIASDREFPHLHNLKWTPCRIKDKHANIHIGYLLGDYTIEEVEVKKEITPSVKIAVLVGGSIEDPLPEAVEAAHLLSDEFQKMNAQLELGFYKAERSSFASAIDNNADLLIYIGHGREDGRLVFSDCLFGAGELRDLQTEGFETKNLKGMFIFACYGSRFARNLDCPWIAFDGKLRREVPRAYMYRLIERWKKERSLNDAIEKVWKDLSPEVAKELGPFIVNQRRHFQTLRLKLVT
jgi:hypothetical protein